MQYNVVFTDPSSDEVIKEYKIEEECCYNAENRALKKFKSHYPLKAYKISSKINNKKVSQAISRWSFSF